MKLICQEVYRDFEDLFTVGESYKVKTVSPNGKMVTIYSDDKQWTMVVYQTSCYGKFTLEVNDGN